MSERGLSVGKKLIFSLAVFGAALALLEGTLRVKYYLQDNDYRILISPFGRADEEIQAAGPEEFRYGQNQSYEIYNRHEKKKYQINITSQNFFYHSLLGPGDSTTLRIFCLGESSTRGYQSYEETYPGYLEKELRARYPGLRVEVVNFGQGGMGLLEIIDRVESQVLEYSPDLFVYYGAYNDADKLKCLEYERVGRMLGRRLSPEGGLQNVLVGLHNLLYLRWSYFYTYIFEKYTLTKYISQAGDPDIDGYRSLLERLRRICRDHGICLVLVSQLLDFPDYPAEFDGIDYRDAETGNRFYKQTAARYSSQGTHSVWIAFRQRTLIKLQKDFCRENGIEFIELRKSFEAEQGSRKDKFYDIVHLSSQGNSLLARLISRELDPDKSCSGREIR